jgi:hypothetical protein
MVWKDETRPEEGAGLAELVGNRRSIDDGTRQERFDERLVEKVIADMEAWLGEFSTLDKVICEAIGWMIDRGWLHVDPPRFTPPEVER